MSDNSAPPGRQRPALRAHARRDLALVAMSFGVTVVVTRLFLALADYPQIGGGTYHIAHALWGGMLLIAAAILPLLWTRQWVRPLAALLAGAGSGLFVDEVGKYITSDNDYFFPLAAPIIYLVFLALLGVRHFATRQQREEAVPTCPTPRSGSDVGELLTADRRPLRAARTIETVGQLERRLVPRPVSRSLLAVGALGAGAVSVAGPVILLVLAVASPTAFDGEVITRSTQPLAASSFQSWLSVAAAGQATVGLLLLSGALLLVLRRDTTGTRILRAGLLLALTGANVALGYVNAELVITVSSPSWSSKSRSSHSACATARVSSPTPLVFRRFC
jgi:hypothetical protein